MGSLKATIGEVQEKYGEDIIAQGSRGKAFTTRQRYTTTIFDLDAAVGGGIPPRFIRAFGPRSGGKSLIMYKSLAGMQLYCRECRAMRLPDGNGELICACPTECEDCGKAYEKTPYEGEEVTEDSPFNWEVIHDEHTCGCRVHGETKRKKDLVPKITHLASPMRGAICDVEHSWDTRWTSAQGVDNNTTFVFVPEYGEGGFDIADALLRSRGIDFLGIDSIANLVPKAMIEASMEDTLVAPLARCVNRGILRLVATINEMGANSVKRPVVFLVNQTRDSLGRGEVTPGGHQQEFQSAIDIRVNAAKYKFKGEGGDSMAELLFADVAGYTKKNKTYTPMRRYAFRAYLSDGQQPCGSTNEEEVVKDRAIEWEVITKEKSNKYSYKGPAGEMVWSTQKAIVKNFREDAHLFWEIRNETLGLEVKELGP